MDEMMERSVLEQEQQDIEDKRKRDKWLRVLIWGFVVLVVSFLVLWLSSKIGRFASIADMFRFIAKFF